MSEHKIERYTGPAGGWGALRSVTNALLRQDIAVKVGRASCRERVYGTV